MIIDLIIILLLQAFLSCCMFYTMLACPQAGCENGISKKSNVTGKTVCSFQSDHQQLCRAMWSRQTPVLTTFSFCSLFRCGVSAAPAAVAERPGSGAFTSHQGPAGGAPAGRRSAGGVLGPDTPHPQSPASCLCSIQRNIAHTHSGQENKVKINVQRQTYVHM